MTTKTPIILASASPRRALLLNMLGTPFSVVHPECDETYPPESPPEEAVKLLAVRKAEEVARRTDSEDIIIAADTMVSSRGLILGKPRDENDAYHMLRTLSGISHDVYTGLAVRNKGRTIAEVQKTRVFFRELRDDEIWDYIRSGTPMDKAGSYGIQDRGALFVTRVEGDFYNVMGLPICLLHQMLKLNTTRGL